MECTEWTVYNLLVLRRKIVRHLSDTIIYTVYFFAHEWRRSVLMSARQAEWYSFQAEQENARQSDEDGIELVVSNYSCSLAARNVRGFNAAYHLYTLVISAKLNGFAERLRQYRSLLDAATGGCRVRCQLRNIVNTIVNQSRPVIEKFVYTSSSSSSSSSYTLFKQLSITFHSPFKSREKLFNNVINMWKQARLIPRLATEFGRRTPATGRINFRIITYTYLTFEPLYINTNCF